LKPLIVELVSLIAQRSIDTHWEGGPEPQEAIDAALAWVTDQSEESRKAADAAADAARDFVVASTYAVAATYGPRPSAAIAATNAAVTAASGYRNAPTPAASVSAAAANAAGRTTPFSSVASVRRVLEYEQQTQDMIAFLLAHNY